MKDVRVLKFDVNSPTDKDLSEIQSNLHAKSNTEAFRRSVAIAKHITRATARGKRVLIETEDGKYQELVVS